MERMTTRRLDSLRKPGRYRADQTLYLIVEPGGSKHWVQRVVVNGRRRDLGLGSYPLTSLSEARERAWQNRQLARRGEDPMPRATRVPTFQQAAAKVDAASQWRGDRTREHRRRALETHAGHLMDHRLDQIGREDVLKILTPIWATKAATAIRLRGWIRAVFSWGQAHGHVEHNIAGEMIAGALPKAATPVKSHHKALAYERVGATLEAVDASGVSQVVKLCLRFVALTACRTSEARLAVWDEVDLGARVWRIPAERTKTGAEHRVPLSGAAVSVLEAVRPHRGSSGLVFPSSRNRALSHATLLKAWQAATGTDTTVHGLRSSFRTWAAEKTNVTRDIAEVALAHRVGSDVERSYARSDLFEKRRALMDRWAQYVTGDCQRSFKFPPPAVIEISPTPLVENNDETSAGGRCGQAVCGLSKARWARLRVHGAGSVHGPPVAHVPAVVGLTTPDFNLSFSRYESPRMLSVVA